MPVKQFKTESKRILDLMIHSIYTHREIFLRELISNASDAIDKLYYRSLTEGETGLSRDDFSIEIKTDSEKRTLTISDNGIGMTKEELENNLGVIARSGSLNFKKEMGEKNEEIDIIGQFGVGFYSAFMVSKCVTVQSRAYGSEEANEWKSRGPSGYSIEPCEKESHGTTITLELLDNTEEENYDEFLSPYRISALVKKYSDYIRYPIRMEMEKTRLKEGVEAKDAKSEDYETYYETETLNSMVPIWKKKKSEVTKEEYDRFYQDKFMDYSEPLRVIYSSTEGSATYNALLFIPSKAPFDYYTREYEKGLMLYANGVMIMEKCADLLPDYFSFVKGLVDSEDLSLNISRELLQHDRQLKLIASRLEKKIKSELLSMLENEREKYEEFFSVFGLQLKYGVYSDYGMHKDLLSDLLLFRSSEGKYVTLKEYVSRMKEGQNGIFYACGDNLSRIEQLPQTETLKEKGFEILYLTDDVDEFALKMLGKFEEKEFKNISSDDLGLASDEEKDEKKKKEEETRPLFDFMTEALSGKVKKVVLSDRLGSHPVCLSAQGGISFEMEKVMNAMPNVTEENRIRAEKVLEINPAHPIFGALQKLYENDQEKLKKYADLLYCQALLIEGFPIEDPVAFSGELCGLMAQLAE